MDILKKGRTVIGQKMNNNMIQYSVFAGIVFIIIAHPQTFKLVDSVIKVHNKNILLLVHAIVVSLIMYFGSLYLFIPAQKVLLEGVENESKIVSENESKIVPKNASKNASRYTYGVPDLKGNWDAMHEEWLNMTVKDMHACDENADQLTLSEIREKCLKMGK